MNKVIADLEPVPAQFSFQSSLAFNADPNPNTNTLYTGALSTWYTDNSPAGIDYVDLD